MWLVNTRSFQLQSFVDEEHAPPYAILSHTWGDPSEEVGFQELNQRTPWKRIRSLAGWKKVKYSCAKALEFKYGHIWIDTCCIDKSSSAQLQEAINSMYAYYARSGICLVYLVDVHPLNPKRKHRYAFRETEFRQALWFTRGWTLQELLAPERTVFFNCAWNNIGEIKHLAHLIQDITGIKRNWFLGDSPQMASVAERMSWAAKRKTTRREDMAYCLLGLFGVSMPLLYGEGSEAFQRLQEEILRSTDDVSIHHWGWQGLSGYSDFDFDAEGEKHIRIAPVRVESVLMAPSAEFFRDIQTHNLPGVPGKTLGRFKSPSFTMGQRGLTAHLPLIQDPNYEGLAYGILGKHGLDEILVLPLISIGCERNFRGEVSEHEYWRPIWCKPILLPLSFTNRASSTEILIRRTPRGSAYFWNLPFRLDLQCSGLTLMGVYPPSPVKGIFITLCTSIGIAQDKGEFGRLMDIHIGKRYFHVNAVTTSDTVPLLLVMDYCLEPTNMRTPWRSDYDLECGCIIDIHVFKLRVDKFSMGEILSFAKKRPRNLEEIPYVWKGTHKYYCVDEMNNIFLDIYLKQKSNRKGHTIVSICTRLVSNDTLFTETTRRFRSYEKRPWRFLSVRDFRPFVSIGTHWEDHVNSCYDPAGRKNIEKILEFTNCSHSLKRVFNDRGLVE